MTVLLWIFLVPSIGLNIVAAYYLYRFAMIILVFEDDITDVLSSLDEVDGALKNMDQLKMYFDDLELRSLAKGVMDSVKMSRYNVNKMSKRFTDRSKRKYILIEDNQENVVNTVSNEFPQNGQIIETFDSGSSRKLKEGTIAHVGRD